MNNENNNVNTGNLELASKNSRIKAFIIDDLLITLVTLLMLWEQIQNVNGDMEAVLVIMNKALIQILVLKFIYQTFFTWYYGATPGKIISKIKIIDFNHLGRISFTTALFRSFTRLISESAFYIGFIFAYYTESRQTLHDKVAKTLVVNA